MIGLKETILLLLAGGVSASLPLLIAYFYIFPKGQR
jgi:hypothetical protein